MNGAVKEYIVWRAKELKHLDLLAFEHLKAKHEEKFNEPATIESIVADDDRCQFWLHWMGDWRIQRMKARMPSRR